MERDRRVKFWRLAGIYAGKALCDAGWRRRLNELHPAFERYLCETGEPAESYPSVYGGEPDYRLERNADGTYSAEPPAEGDDGESTARERPETEEKLFARHFGLDEIQGKELAVERLLGDVCGALGILPGVQPCGSGLYRLGTRQRRSVFAYLASACGTTEVLTAHLAAAGPMVDVYVAHKTAEIEACGMLAKVEMAQLADELEIGADGAFGRVDSKGGERGRRSARDEGEQAAEAAENGRGKGKRDCVFRVIRDGESLEYSHKTYLFAGARRWKYVRKLADARGGYVPCGKGLKGYFAKNKEAKAFFEAAVRAEGTGRNGTGRYKLKI